MEKTYLAAIALLCAGFVMSATNFPDIKADEPGKTAETADSTGFTFTDIVTIPTTSVKDQNKSGTCWCFSGTSMMEDEIVRKGGKPLDLSEMFTVRQCYIDKADKYVRMYGGINFGPGEIGRAHV